MTCPICQTRFTPAGRQRYCSGACRKTALRRRHQDQPPAPVPRQPAPGATTPSTNAPTAGSGSPASSAAPTAQIFARRIGLGGPCPHCGEPVALTDLLEKGDAMNPRR